MDGVLDTLYFMSPIFSCFVVVRVDRSSVFGEKTKTSQIDGEGTRKPKRSLRVFGEHSLGFLACPIFFFTLSTA